MKPVISVVVPIFNSEKTIIRCINALKKLNYKKFEIILVDDGSTDFTPSIIKEIPDKRFKYFHQENAGPAAARNLGAKQAKGDILAFMDSDCVPYSNWLNKIEKHFKDKEVIGVEGYVKTDKMSILTQSVRVDKGGRYLTANIFYRKKEFLQEKFDEQFKFAFREDSDLGLRMAKRGKIIFEKTAKIYHIPREINLFSLMKRQKMYYFDPLFVKKHGNVTKRSFLDDPRTRSRLLLLSLISLLW